MNYTPVLLYNRVIDLFSKSSHWSEVHMIGPYEMYN